MSSPYFAVADSSKITVKVRNLSNCHNQNQYDSESNNLSVSHTTKSSCHKLINKRYKCKDMYDILESVHTNSIDETKDTGYILTPRIHTNKGSLN